MLSRQINLSQQRFEVGLFFFNPIQRYMPSVSHPTARTANQGHEQLSVQYSKARAPASAMARAPPPPTRAPVTADASKAPPIPAPRAVPATLKKPAPKKPGLKAPSCPPPLPPPSQQSAVPPVAQWGAGNTSNNNVLLSSDWNEDATAGKW